MKTSESRYPLSADDGYPMEVYGWNADAPPARAVVQIAHGMGEHTSRYRALAEALTGAGYAVYANEHRGHGADAAGRGELGEFGTGGFASLVADMATLSRFARSRHPGAPLILMGHSMGSFATQVYMLDHSALVQGIALSGTTAVDLLGTQIMAGWKLEDANAAFPNPRTPFDWLSRDPATVDAYMADSLCGFTVTPASFQSMLLACARATPVDAYQGVRADLPLFAFVGDQDPINNHLEWFYPLLQRYQRAGLTNVSSHVFGGARHEVFNETNRAEVVADFLSWIEQTVLGDPRKKTSDASGQ
ncbi:alpha/beta hydrolase [Rhodoferax sp. UBA5149]|uniref:alpha/beta hydrolase n=1 Tax=Rhodoferax sp. UBA5149 TaxID=1947379 RepID=UPI0025D1CFDA|nr:alpha/beta hydrolase [Rhodoferax sp. UBA5149]